MKRHSIYNIVLSVFILSIIVIGFLIYFSIVSHEKDLFQSAINEKIKMAEMIRETIASPAWLYKMSVLGDLEKGVIAGLSRFEGVSFIRIVRENGEVYQSTFSKEIGSIIKDPDAGKAIKTGLPIVKDNVFNGEMIKLLIYPGYENQTIWIGFSLKDAELLIKDVLRRYLSISLSIFILLGSTTIIILRSIVDPIKQMTIGCQDIKEGNFDIALETKQKTEIGELASAFNEMAEEVKQSRDKLEKERKALEIKVSDRTKELQELAKSLEKQVEERTGDLSQKIKELETFNRIALGREVRIAELKEEIKKLKEK